MNFVKLCIWPSIFLLSLQLYGFEESGIASWYGGEFQGRKTANGEIFDTHELTAAHKTLPFDTLVVVTNEENGKEVLVRINDRGPYIEGRIIDLSHEAARLIDMVKSGTARVKVVSEDPTLTIPSLDRPLDFTIQVGSFSNLENALRMKKMLIKAGFSPQASLNNKGITRIFLSNIGQDECYGVVKTLEALGISGMLIKQNI